MICQNCQKGFQAAEAWEWGDDTGLLADEHPQLIHPTHRSFLESVLRGCPICRCVWRQLVKEYKQQGLSADASLPNHDEVKAHLKLIRSLAKSHSSSQDTPIPPLPDVGALAISDAISKDGISLALQLWQQNAPVLDPSSKSCPVVVWTENDAFEVQAGAEGVKAVVSFKLVPVTRHDGNLARLKGTMGGYGSKACTSANPQLWKLWLDWCLEKHDECNKTLRMQSSFFPRRLVEINSDEKRKPMTWRVKRVGETEKCPYMTLSHCWGDLQHSNRLTQATLERFLQDDSLVSTLPKTFQDAMSITLSLGFRYIWIDSLCIIQDDDDDWKDQSSVMGLIYKHATCNIAATWAGNGAEGCFSPRNPADVEPGPWKMKLSREPKTKKREFRVVRDDYEHVVEDAPLNTRGWVLQERCLSPRQLQFTKDEVYWECSRYIASERFPAGMPKDSGDEAIQGHSLGKPRLNHRKNDKLQYAWAEVVQQYSRASLTFYTDKTIAISGLANELTERHGDQYLAGLWKRDLQRQLCWSVDLCRNYSPPVRRFRGDGPYIAPTWSWMSVDSPVDYDTWYWAQGYWQDYDAVLHLAQVLSVSVRSAHTSGLHSFLDGSLRLRVMGVWCRGVVDTEGDFETTDHILRQPSDPAKRSAGAFSALLQGRKIDIVWDEGVSQHDETIEEVGTGEDGTSEEEGTSEDHSSSEEEESGDDGWSTCDEDEEASEENPKSKWEEPGDDKDKQELVGQEEEQGGNAISGNTGSSKEAGVVNEEGPAISDDGRRLPRDLSQHNDSNKPSGLAAGAVDQRRCDLLLAFVHLCTEKPPERKLVGLVLAERPGSNSTEFVRLGVFEHEIKKRKGAGSKMDLVELFKSRLGWNGRKFGALDVDLGDARFADIVHIVTIV